MFLEFDKKTGYVLKIHEEMPDSVPPENGIFENDMFKPGDEVTFSIHATVDEDGNIVGFGGVRQAPFASYLVQKIKDGEKQQELMQKALDDLILGGM